MKKMVILTFFLFSFAFPPHFFIFFSSIHLYLHHTSSRISSLHGRFLDTSLTLSFLFFLHSEMTRWDQHEILVGTPYVRTPYVLGTPYLGHPNSISRCASYSDSFFFIFFFLCTLYIYVYSGYTKSIPYIIK